MWNKIIKIWSLISVVLIGMVVIMFATGKLKLGYEKPTEPTRNNYRREVLHFPVTHVLPVNKTFYVLGYRLYAPSGILCGAQDQYTGTLKKDDIGFYIEHEKDTPRLDRLCETIGAYDRRSNEKEVIDALLSYGLKKVKP